MENIDCCPPTLLSSTSGSYAEEKIRQVFSCCHAFETILKYLSFTDLKELSLCSKLLLNAVRSSKQFSKSASIMVSKESWDSSVLSKTTYCWLNGKIELSWLPPESYSTYENVLKTMTSLKVQLTSDPLEKMLEKKLNFHLPRILSSAVALKSLWLDPSILQWILHDTFSNVRVQERLMKLRELHLSVVPDHRNNTLEKFSLGESDEYSDAEDDEEEGPFPRNIFQISLIPMPLQAFSFVVQNEPCFKNGKFNEFVPNIMKKSGRLLVDLTISLDSSTIGAIESLLFPSLKSLNVKVANFDFGGGKEVGTIIRNQPSLTSLSVSVYTFSPQLLDSIVARSSKLKILHLEAKIWSLCISPRDWNFLSNLTNLKEFNLFCADSLNITIIKILQLLPSQLEKITINGISGIYKHFGQDEDETIKMIAVLTKFRNLMQLSLLGCENAINDDILDHMYYHMKQLTVLEFSICQNVTDKGLTGVRDEVFMGVSIQNLLGLKKLTMRSCRHLTSGSLQKIIKFPHLKSLDISGIKISEEAALEIAASNPCLETFVASFEYNQDSPVGGNPFFKYSIKDKILAANPRTQDFKVMPFRTEMEVVGGDSDDVDEI